MNVRRILGMMVALLMVTNLMHVPIQASGNINFTVSRTLEPANGIVMTGEEMTLRYIIQPTDIPAAQVKAAEIALVIDTSGSMNDKDNRVRRIDAAKAAARKFINNFKNTPNVKISIIEYASYATIRTGLLPASDARLINQVNGLYATGATNIGDGIRLAFHQLKAGNPNANKFMIFMTDGKANRSSRKRNGYYNYRDGYYRNNGGYISRSGGYTYARKMTEQVQIGSFQNPSPGTYIKPYFVAFSNNAWDLKTIAYYNGDGSRPRVTGLEYNNAGNAQALEAYYDQISKKIKDSLAVNLTFRETFMGDVSIDSILSSDVSGITPSMVQQRTINGGLMLESVNGGWPVVYKLDRSTNRYKADPITLTIRARANKGGRFNVGGLGSSYVKYVTDSGVQGTVDFVADSFMAYDMNAPIINMSQSFDLTDKNFSLSYAGLGTMRFGGNSNGDYVSFGNSWSNQFFSDKTNQWTIKATITPKVLEKELTNHRVKNVFIAKASDRYNDNLEIGIDDNGNLLLYLDTKAVDTPAITLGNGELTPGMQHDIIITYDNGDVTVSLDGNGYRTNHYVRSGNTMDYANSPLTLGGSLHQDTFFNGLINEVALYDKAFSETDFIDGVSGTDKPYAKWTPKGSTVNQVVDSSGHGRHSTSIHGAVVQGDIGADDIKLYYRVGEDGPSNKFALYTPGTTKTALDTFGAKTVYAYAVYDPGDGRAPFTSPMTSKRATKARNTYIESVNVAMPSTSLSEGERFTLGYTLVGGDVILSDESATVAMTPITVEIDYPAHVTVATDASNNKLMPSWLRDNGAGKLTGTITDAKLHKGSDASKYFGQTYHYFGDSDKDYNFNIVFETKDWRNFTFQKDAIKLNFTGHYGMKHNHTGGQGTDFKVRPDAPTLNDVGTGNVLFQRQIRNVQFSGTSKTAYKGFDVSLRAVGTDQVGHPKVKDGRVPESSVTPPTVTVGNDGTFISPVIDLNSFDVKKALKVEAYVTDSEGDTSATTNKPFTVRIDPFNIDIK